MKNYGQVEQSTESCIPLYLLNSFLSLIENNGGSTAGETASLAFMYDCRVKLRWRCLSRYCFASLVVTILPPFFHFSHSRDFTCPLVSHATYPVHPACASKSRDLSSLILHSRALSSLPTFSFGSLRLCHGFLSRSSDSFVYDSLVPFSTIHLPHLVRFLIPIDVTDTSRFTLIRGLMLLSLIPY